MNIQLFQDQSGNSIRRFLGSKDWEPKYFARYTHVANINIQQPIPHSEEIYEILDQGFSIHNGCDILKDSYTEILTPLLPHSMSVSDIIKYDRVHYIVDPVGFTPVVVFDGTKWYYK